MVYYDKRHIFDLRRPVTAVFGMEALVPNGGVGLSCILAMIVVHLSHLLAAALFFLRRTEASALGNAWQSIAQVVAPETDPMVRVADGMRDAEVTSWATKSGYGAGIYGISRSRHRGRKEVQLQGLARS